MISERAHSGKTFCSLFEMRIEEALTKAKVKHEYEGQKLHYHLPDSEIRHFYTPDWVFPKTSIIIEAKGWPFKKKERDKYRLVKKQNPQIDFRFIFQDASLKIWGKSGITYGEFAKKFGFKWSTKTIPDSWINEIQEQQQQR